MQRTATYTGPFGELRIEQEMTEVTAMAEPDPNWRYTDRHGHEHAYVPGEGDHYPTQVIVEDEPYWCEDCEEEHQFNHRECAICGEEITPGVRTPLGPTYIPGMKQALLNDEPITVERAAEIIAEARQATNNTRTE